MVIGCYRTICSHTLKLFCDALITTSLTLVDIGWGDGLLPVISITSINVGNGWQFGKDIIGNIYDIFKSTRCFEITCVMA